MKLNINYFYVMAGQGSNYVFPVLIYPILILKLGMESFGWISLGVIISQFLILIIEYGFGYFSAKDISCMAREDEKLQYYMDVVFSKVIILTFLSIILLFLGFFFEGFARSILVISLLGCVFFFLNPSWFFQANAEFKKLAIVSLSSRIVTAFLIFIMIDDGDLLKALFLFVMQYAFLSCFGLFFMNLSMVRWRSLSINKSIILLKNGLPFFLSTLATSIYTLMTPIILGFSIHKGEIGIYNAVSVIKQGLSGVVAPLIQVVYSQMINLKVFLMSRDDYEIIIRKKILIIFFIVFVPALLVIIFSKQVSQYIFGSYNAGFIYAIQVTAITPLFIVFNSSLSTFVYLVLGKTNIMLRCTGVCSLICLIMAYPVSVMYGANGIITLLLSVEIFVGLLLLLFYLKFR